MMNGKLSGKVAIVTGAASGISRATALLFAEEGAFTIIADLDETGGEQAVTEAKEMGGNSEFHCVDVTDSAQVKTLMDDTLARHGSLDILVNGAAYQTETGPVAEVTEEEWDSGLGLFLKGPFLGCKYAIPAMLKGGGGAIINISSAVVLRGSTFSLPYSVSKAGIVQLTKTASSQYCEQWDTCQLHRPRCDRHPRLPTRVPLSGHHCEVCRRHSRGPHGRARGRRQARPLPSLRRR